MTQAASGWKLTVCEEAAGVAEGARILHHHIGGTEEGAGKDYKAKEGSPQAGDGDVGGDC